MSTSIRWRVAGLCWAGKPTMDNGRLARPRSGRSPTGGLGSYAGSKRDLHGSREFLTRLQLELSKIALLHPGTSLLVRLVYYHHTHRWTRFTNEFLFGDSIGREVSLPSRWYINFFRYRDECYLCCIRISKTDAKAVGFFVCKVFACTCQLLPAAVLCNN